MKKLLLFDLDGTLLKTDKTISERTLATLDMCKSLGCLIGISTSRSEQNCHSFLEKLEPNILISSGGALIKYNNEYIYKNLFSNGRTSELIKIIRTVCGDNVEITVDTIDRHYWNYKTDPKQTDTSWGDSIWTDYNNFSDEALKICAEIFDEKSSLLLGSKINDCDMVRFSDGYWYKITKKGATKENAIKIICDMCDIKLSDVIAFGDDYADIDMLKLSGVGIAMGNAINEVKKSADIIIGSNDDDGIAVYLENYISH